MFNMRRIAPATYPHKYVSSNSDDGRAEYRLHRLKHDGPLVSEANWALATGHCMEREMAAVGPGSTEMKEGDLVVVEVADIRAVELIRDALAGLAVAARAELDRLVVAGVDGFL